MMGAGYPDLFGAAQIRRSASLSKCGAFRFTLERAWGAGPQVCFVGLNPSTADHTTDDPTVRRWMRFGKAWGFGSFVAVNLYPYRSSSPAECRRWSQWEDNGPDWHARDVLFENLNAVQEAAKTAAMVVACWGAGTWNDAWTEHVVERVQSGPEPWPDIHCFRRSQDGSPVHPMARGKHRVPEDAMPQVWRPTISPKQLAAE